jgi:hypothetical protein
MHKLKYINSAEFQGILNVSPSQFDHFLVGIPSLIYAVPLNRGLPRG